MEKAADYLGMDAADLRKALDDGKSLADLAKDKGKSVEQLEQALREAIRKDADKAVDHGTLTKEQADHIVEKLGSCCRRPREGRPVQAPSSSQWRSAAGRAPPPRVDPASPGWTEIVDGRMAAKVQKAAGRGGLAAPVGGAG